MLPQEFTQEVPDRTENLTLLLAGLSVALHPRAASPGKLQPYLLAGAGGQKASGELDNTGFFLSGAVGVLTNLTARVSLDGGLQLLRLKYTQTDRMRGWVAGVPLETHPKGVS